jgi:hypothetical protein
MTLAQRLEWVLREYRWFRQPPDRPRTLLTALRHMARSTSEERKAVWDNGKCLHPELDAVVNVLHWRQMHDEAAHARLIAWVTRKKKGAKHVHGR